MSDTTSDEVLTFIKQYKPDWREGESAFPLAIKLMLEHVNNNTDSFVCLKDDKIRIWWGGLISKAEKAIELRKKRIVTYKAKMEVFNRLTQAERSALGIVRPKRPAGYKDE